MRVVELQRAFLADLASLLGDWRFVKSTRSFVQRHDPVQWSFHIAFVQHTEDIDVVGDVAVELLDTTGRICIVGAELGNIEGSGQRRFSLRAPDMSREVAGGVHAFFLAVGIPFLKRFSSPSETLKVLRAGGSDAMLISPLIQTHAAQIAALERYVAADA